MRITLGRNSSKIKEFLVTKDAIKNYNSTERVHLILMTSNIVLSSRYDDKKHIK